jgi:hypothetical protein
VCCTVWRERRGAVNDQGELGGKPAAKDQPKRCRSLLSVVETQPGFANEEGLWKRAEYKEVAHTTLITTMLELVHKWYLLSLLPGHRSMRRSPVKHVYLTPLLVRGKILPLEPWNEPLQQRQTRQSVLAAINHLVSKASHVANVVPTPRVWPSTNQKVTYYSTYDRSTGPDCPSPAFTARLYLSVLKIGAG